jgi:tight adherence protein C
MTLTLILVLCSVPVLVAVYLLGDAWFNRATTGTEAWRDRAPAWMQVLRPFVNMLLNPMRERRAAQPVVEDNAKHSNLHQRLLSAGYGYAIRPDEFICARWILLIIMSLVFVFTYFRLPDLGNGWLVLIALTIPLAYIYPDIWLSDMTKRRKKKIARDFPFFLDLLVLSMRAGLNFSSAIAHGADKMRAGPLREELQSLIRAIRTGKSRREALDELAVRVALPPVSNFVAAVNQAEEVGGELGELLSKQAAQRRKERFLRAEEEANKAPVKMLLPLIGILFPMTFVIIGFTLFIKARDSGVLDFMN